MSHRSQPLKTGKLPGPLLQSLLDGLPKVETDARLLVGPGVGEDAAHILFGENTLLAKTDPITFATDRIGWYAINVNANDIAVAGGTPKWFLATLMMPPGSVESEVRAIFSQLGEAASDIGVQLAGGHTEITHAVTQPVVCGFMIGEAPTSRTVSASGANAGDLVILTKGIAIEGTAILANECREQLIEAGLDAAVIDAASQMLTQPGISVLNDAKAATATGAVSAMHDPTEGGLATALQELAFASDVDIVVDVSKVHVFPECEAICSALGIDPWGLISSGALLATVEPNTQDDVIQSLISAGIDAQIIGYATAKKTTDDDANVYVADQSDGKPRPITHFERDELARYFDQTAQ